MHSNFIEIILPRGCSHVNLLHICRTAVLTNIYGKVLLPILLIMPVIFFNTNLCPFLQALTALRITPEFCLRFSNTMCPVYRIEEWHKLAVSSNHREKWKRIVSGDLGGHSTSWYKATTRLTNFSWSLCLTAFKQCAGAPS